MHMSNKPQRVLFQYGTKAQKNEKKIKACGEDREQVDRLMQKKAAVSLSTAAPVNGNVPVS